MRVLIATAAAALLATAASAQTTGAMSSSSMSSSGAMSATDYVTMAGQSDQFEIQEGQLAQSQGKSARVKAFGKQMIADHTKSTAMVVAAAKKAGMTPSTPQLRPDQQQMISQLQATSGDDFDRLYIQQQTQSHQEALQLQQGYAQNGDSKPLKAAAAKITPVVQQHLTMLQQMNSMAMLSR
jgi:putative membrane protein